MTINAGVWCSGQDVSIRPNESLGAGIE